MARRQYSNIALDTTLVSGINSAVTSFSITAATGWPAAPFIGIINEGLADEELVLVGARSGTSLSSVTRGYGGSTAQSHSAGATFKHVAAAEDYTFIWTHAHDGADDSATVAHSSTTGRTANDHHNQSHAHNGADGSGTVAHSATTGKTANDHHNQVHAIDGADHTGQLDHGGLLGLADDDHTQYLKVDGTRAMTGALDMGAQAITNVGNVDGVDVSVLEALVNAHASRHLSTGADPITNLGGYIAFDVAYATTDTPLTTTLSDLVSITATKPAEWGGYKAFWFGSWTRGGNTPASQQRFLIDGVATTTRPHVDTGASGGVFLLHNTAGHTASITASLQGRITSSGSDDCYVAMIGYILVRTS